MKEYLTPFNSRLVSYRMDEEEARNAIKGICYPLTAAALGVPASWLLGESE